MSILALELCFYTLHYWIQDIMKSLSPSPSTLEFAFALIIPPASSFLYLLIRIHISLRFYAFYCSSCLTFVSSTRCHSFLFSLSKRILSSTVRNDLSPSSTPSHPLPFYQYCNRVFYCFYNLLLYSYIMFSAFSSNRLMVTNERRSYTNLHGRTSTGI